MATGQEYDPSRYLPTNQPQHGQQPAYYGEQPYQMPAGDQATQQFTAPDQFPVPGEQHGQQPKSGGLFKRVFGGAIESTLHYPQQMLQQTKDLGHRTAEKTGQAKESVFQRGIRNSIGNVLAFAAVSATLVGVGVAEQQDLHSTLAVSAAKSVKGYDGLDSGIFGGFHQISHDGYEFLFLGNEGEVPTATVHLTNNRDCEVKYTTENTTTSGPLSWPLIKEFYADKATVTDTSDCDYKAQLPAVVAER